MTDTLVMYPSPSADATCFSDYMEHSHTSGADIIQLIKIFLDCFGTRMFVTVFTR
jgi:hypothetical protein